MATTLQSSRIPADLDPGAGQLLALIRSHGALTRAQMNAMTGWARMTVTSRLEQLLAVKLLLPDEPTAGARGRPATRFRIAPQRAALMVADVGALGMRLARCDLTSVVEETADLRCQISDGPQAVLAQAEEGLRNLAGDPAIRPVWGVGISLPGPVEFQAGRVVSPPIMTGWHGVAVRDIVTKWFGSPVLVDNDVNAMAVGERAVSYPDAGDLLVVKVGTGVGAGLICGGRVVRGAAGAAGDIGHTWADPSGIRSDVPECRCGKRGCVEAYVGGWAIARDLGRELGSERSVDDVTELLRAGDSTTVRLVRDAGRILGASLATAVSLLNPSAVVLGGQIAAASGEHLLAGLRERIYARSLPLATRDLPIKVSTLWPNAGVHGLARGIADTVLGAPAG
ncbi:MAG: ROK family protein [Marmoricola sp.]